MESKSLKDIAKIEEFADGVNIEITEHVDENKIENMLNACKTGQCDCMSTDMKNKITSMYFKKENGKLNIVIVGNVSKEDIKASMERCECYENAWCSK
ncbi:MAG: hypothetical protein RXR65_06320 [Hydrogenobaculum sp.]